MRCKHYSGRLTRLSFPAIFLVAISCAGAPLSPKAPAPQGKADGLSVGELVGVIKDALRDARRDIGTENLPDLKAVELSLKTETSKTLSGEFQILVKAAGSVAKTTSDQLTIELVPPPAGGPVSGVAPVYEALRRAIVAAAAGAREAKVAGKADLEVKAVSVEIGFELVKTKEAGVGGEFFGITVSAGGELSRARSHTITVTFEKP